MLAILLIFYACLNNFFQRGKFRPRLTELVQTNTEKEVIDASTEAFQKLPDVPAAIQALTVLRAIGPATASGACYGTMK